MTPREIWTAAGEGFDEGNDVKVIEETRPLLAHYTSTSNLEAILKGRQIWLSHPMTMNDTEEVRFGMNHGMQIFNSSIRVEGPKFHPAIVTTIQSTMHAYFNEFAERHLFDIYVTCFTRHDPDDNDGVLSMFRAYAEFGKGAALVFNTHMVREKDPSPFVMAEVRYGRNEERVARINRNIEVWWRNIQKMNLQEDQVGSAVRRIFDRLMIDALIWKHRGFREEAEWRMIYLRHWDVAEEFTAFLSYHNGPRGPEPKFKLPLKPLATSDLQWNFPDIINRIILGPSISSAMAKRTIERMLDEVGLPELKAKVIATTIPLRPV